LTAVFACGWLAVTFSLKKKLADRAQTSDEARL
jgi:hypothetical protein